MTAGFIRHQEPVHRRRIFDVPRQTISRSLKRGQLDKSTICVPVIIAVSA